MPSTRIFIGGLSDKVDRQELGGKLSSYAPVLSVDIKEKTDPEGNVLLRFAYANIDAVPSQVEQCIQQLNGAAWKGSHLRVERAKESFLDRLNRERTARKEENSYFGKSDTLAVKSQGFNASDKESSLVQPKGHRIYQEQNSVINDGKHSKKRKESDANEESGFAPKKKSPHTNDEISQKDSYSLITRKEKKKSKNEVEEEILSSFKQFSSVWADSDNENEEGTVVKPHYKSQRGSHNSRDADSHRVNQNEDTDDTVDEDDDGGIGSYTDLKKEQQTQLNILESLDDPHKCASKIFGRKSTTSNEEPVMKDDSILPDHQHHRAQAAADKPTTDETIPSVPEASSKYVKVSKDLSFGQNTSGFSLLAQFSKINKEVATEVEEEVVTASVSVPKSLVTVHQKVKERPFFISDDDREIQAAIKWMTQPITEEVIKEFEEVLPDLRQVIRTRSFRAKKEEADPRMQRRGRGRGRGRGQGRGRAGGDDKGNPYRDHRWRERDVKK